MEVLWLCIAPLGRPVVPEEHDEEEVVVAGGADDHAEDEALIMSSASAKSVIGGVADVDPTGDLGAIGAGDWSSATTSLKAVPNTKVDAPESVRMNAIRRRRDAS